jgi:hypothetical protein
METVHTVEVTVVAIPLSKQLRHLVAASFLVSYSLDQTMWLHKVEDTSCSEDRRDVYLNMM